MFVCMRALERTLREWACVHTMRAHVHTYDVCTDMRRMYAQACVGCVRGHVYDVYTQTTPQTYRGCSF